MVVKSYQDLIVWQKAMNVATMIYSLVKKLPKEELFALSDQMRRAAVSIPSNIAEGQARNSTREFLQFLAIARGSKAELETQLLLCVQVNYLAPTDISEVMEQLQEVGKMLHALTKTLTTAHYLLLNGQSQREIALQHNFVKQVIGTTSFQNIVHGGKEVLLQLICVGIPRQEVAGIQFEYLESHIAVPVGMFTFDLLCSPADALLCN